MFSARKLLCVTRPPNQTQVLRLSQGVRLLTGLTSVVQLQQSLSRTFNTHATKYAAKANRKQIKKSATDPITTTATNSVAKTVAKKTTKAAREKQKGKIQSSSDNANEAIPGGVSESKVALGAGAISTSAEQEKKILLREVEGESGVLEAMLQARMEAFGHNLNDAVKAMGGREVENGQYFIEPRKLLQYVGLLSQAESAQEEEMLLTQAYALQCHVAKSTYEEMMASILDVADRLQWLASDLEDELWAMDDCIESVRELINQEMVSNLGGESEVEGKDDDNWY